MFKDKILTRRYRKLLKKLMNAAATPELDKLVIKDKKEIVMVQMLQLMGLVGDCFKANREGHLVLQTERNLLTSLAKQITIKLV